MIYTMRERKRETEGGGRDWVDVMMITTWHGLKEEDALAYSAWAN